MKKTILFFAVVTALCACSKGGNSPTNSQTSASLMGKWKIARISDTIFNYPPYYTPGDYTANVPGDPGEYVDFEAGGKLYCYDWYEAAVAREFVYDTVSYSVSGSQVVFADTRGFSDTATVEQVGADSLTLFFSGVVSIRHEHLWDCFKR
jgi:hypothetical protein